MVGVIKSYKLREIEQRFDDTLPSAHRQNRRHLELAIDEIISRHFVIVRFIQPCIEVVKKVTSFHSTLFISNYDAANSAPFLDPNANPILFKFIR